MFNTSNYFFNTLPSSAQLFFALFYGLALNKLWLSWPKFPVKNVFINLSINHFIVGKLSPGVNSRRGALARTDWAGWVGGLFVYSVQYEISNLQKGSLRSHQGRHTTASRGRGVWGLQLRFTEPLSSFKNREIPSEISSHTLTSTTVPSNEENAARRWFDPSVVFVQWFLDSKDWTPRCRHFWPCLRHQLVSSFLFSSNFFKKFFFSWKSFET